MQPIPATQLIPLSVAARSQVLQERAVLASIPENIHPDLHRAYQISTVLTPALPDFIQYQIQTDISNGSVLERNHQSTAIETECDRFADRFIL